MSGPDNDYADRQQDSTFLEVNTVTYVMVDLTRGYGHKREHLLTHESRKREVYTQMLQSLRERHTIKFFPLACTYNGAIAEDTWRAFMDRLGLDAKAQIEVLQAAAKAICLSFSTMVDIRHGALLNHTSHTSGDRH